MRVPALPSRALFAVLLAVLLALPAGAGAEGGTEDGDGAREGAGFVARYELALGEAPDGPEFRRPTAVSTDLFGNVFVADTGNDRVIHFDPDGRFVIEFGGFGWAEGELAEPTDVCAREGFQLFVVDAGNDRIQKFDIGDSSPAGLAFPFREAAGLGGEELVRPYRMDLDAEGRIYFSDSLCHCIWIFAPTGELVGQLGGLGEGPTRFRDPGGVAVGRGGRVFVADTGNRRIQVFDALGNWVAAWGGPDADLLVAPVGIDVGPEGTVYVADAGSGQVHVFDPGGVPLFAFGAFAAPVDVAVTAGGHVYVVDEERETVERFRILRDAPAER